MDIAGADEAGRGAMAGPLVAAAVILSNNSMIEGLNDSKLLSSKKRFKLAEEIKEKAVSFSIETVEKDEIDEIGVHRANLKALGRAVLSLVPSPGYSLIDGFDLKGLAGPSIALKGGDRRSLTIAAASILAKVERDRLMLLLHDRYPKYRFDCHKGYCTQEHIELIERYGPLPEVHRFSFAPVEAAQNRYARNP